MCDNIVRPHLQASFENFSIDESTDATIQKSFDDFDHIISSNLALIPEKTIKEKYLAKWWTKELSAKRQDYNKSLRRSYRTQEKKEINSFLERQRR